ncbi:hypothetical protein AtNW77_Chr5g0111871 [Arabidopsis thaliana]
MSFSREDLFSPSSLSNTFQRGKQVLDLILGARVFMETYVAMSLGSASGITCV